MNPPVRHIETIEYARVVQRIRIEAKTEANAIGQQSERITDVNKVGIVDLPEDTIEIKMQKCFPMLPFNTVRMNGSFVLKRSVCTQ